MPARAVVPAERVVRVRPAPAQQFGAPRHRAVHHRAAGLVPHAVGGDAECRHGGIDERVGRVGDDFLGQRAAMTLGGVENPGRFSTLYVSD